MIRRNPSPYDAAVTRAARAAVIAVDSAEVPLLEDLLNPPRHILPWRRPDAVGFGVEDAVQWVSPYAVAAALWYGKVLFDEGKSVVEDRTRATVRKLLQRGEPEVIPPTVTGTRLDANGYAAQVKRVAEYAVSLGLDETRALVLAEAVVGSMLRETADPADD